MEHFEVSCHSFYYSTASGVYELSDELFTSCQKIPLAVFQQKIFYIITWFWWN